ncbi:MAG: PilW family protein [Planctomycetota bacterium]|jgi:prepilin-type N-terminal cleavage/methylation domain-containing protein
MRWKISRQKGFTLIELVVAIAILGFIVSSMGIIFKISIETYRTALANAEIMQKFRAISTQLDNDFQNVQKDAPLIIWFQHDENGRYDKMMFFATGDFQSTQRYFQPPASTTDVPLAYQDEDYTSISGQNHKSVRGNMARIYYGLANMKEGASILMPWDVKDERLGERILTRRRHILTSDAGLIEWPDKDLYDFKEPYVDPLVPNLAINERFEHDRLSINQWKNIDIEKYKSENILDVSFGDSQQISPVYSKYSWVDLSKSATFHNIMCEGVVSFAVQCAYWDRYDLSRERLRWFPTVDLDGLKASPQTDSQFELQQTESGFSDRFGVLFNVGGDPGVEGWIELEESKYGDGATDKFDAGFYPKALKFTIKIYDSKGIIEDGRTFTKIIFLDK